VRLQEVYGEGRDREGMIFALAEHKLPESFRILSQALQQSDVTERDRNLLVEALGRLSDPRATPLLRAHEVLLPSFVEAWEAWLKPREDR